ncbi:TPA: hypothetical protein N0F65_007017 [Lagenidium giganteum]|uniref:Uncharacterized protein n=1 Tax=Lagenidium giganteum TaxID=4803 RepID=A0AAV2ZQH8_9STRA|nr:TPA: hypothetical protein N0F65_007017 [Lagenidium giganteum]
MRGMASHHR